MSDMFPPPLRVWLTIWVSNRSKCDRLNAPVNRSMCGAKSVTVHLGCAVTDACPERARSAESKGSCAVGLPRFLGCLVEAIVMPNGLISHGLNVLIVEVGRDGSRDQRNSLANCLETTLGQRVRGDLPQHLGAGPLH